MPGLDMENPRVKLARQLTQLIAHTKREVLYPASGHFSMRHRMCLEVLSREIPATVNALLLATRLQSRASGFIQGGLFGMALGFVAFGLSALAQYFAVPHFLYGWVAGAACGAGLAHALRKQKRWSF